MGGRKGPAETEVASKTGFILLSRGEFYSTANLKAPFFFNFWSRVAGDPLEMDVWENNLYGATPDLLIL